MTVDDIQKLLVRFDISERSGFRTSNLNGNDDGTLIHSDNDGRWMVDDLDRGERQYVRKFDSENAACVYFLGQIRVGYRWSKTQQTAEILKAIDHMLDEEAKDRSIESKEDSDSTLSGWD